MVAVLLSGIAMGRATATTSVRFDAEWWRGLTDSEKVKVVQGAMSGYTEGVHDGVTSMRSQLRVVLMNNGTSASRADQIIKRFSVPNSDFSKTFGTYIHEVGDFYDNYPSASGAEVGNTLLCLTDQPTFDCSTVAGFYSK